jgi:hypothetical protein
VRSGAARRLVTVTDTIAMNAKPAKFTKATPKWFFASFVVDPWQWETP